jgi:hypothetical protein
MGLRFFARRLGWALLGVSGALLVCAPAAWSFPVVGSPFEMLGLPSLHSIIEALAKGFFSALAGALVPGFLKHGSVATLQHLVALPDPASWGHVGALGSDMTFLGMSLMPLTLAVSTIRYWLLGLTGGAHPVSGLARCVWATGLLVAYRWLVEQTVAATNTITHAILGFPVVADGLASIISVLFGGALLAGAGGVFGAVLVIIGVVFAAGLFAAAEALTVLLALTMSVGPPFIALSPIPELSHLARVWGHALLTIALIPIGWTALFATAGALTLDATSFTGGANGLPAHIAAAFAGLITFVIAVRLVLALFGSLWHTLTGALHGHASSPQGGGAASLAGGERIRAAHSRLRAAALAGGPSLGRSVGQAAGALGAPAGGPLGAARRRLASTATGSRISALVTSTPARARQGASAARAGRGAAVRGSGHGGVRERLTLARGVLARAPGQARAAIRQSLAPVVQSAPAGGLGGKAGRRAGTAQTVSGAGAPGRDVRGTRGSTGTVSSPARASTPPRTRVVPPAPRAAAAGGGREGTRAAGGHAGRKVSATAQRDSQINASVRYGPTDRSARAVSPRVAPAPTVRAPAVRAVRRKPRPRSKG